MKLKSYLFSLPTRIRRIDLVLAIIALISLIIRHLIPPYINYNSPNDDSLGVSLAYNLIHGKWLGPWNVNTFAKPPGYSIYLAIIHFTFITPTTFTHILYLLVSLYFVRVALRIFAFSNEKKVNISRVVFLFFAINPIVLGGPFSRIYRVNLDMVLSMLFAILVFDITLRIGNINIFDHKKPIDGSKKMKINLLTVALGFDYAGMVLLRSEAYWELYALALTIAVGVGSNFLRMRRIGIKKLPLKFFATPILLGVVFAALPVLMVETVNHGVYGVSQVEDFYSGSFARTYQDLEGVVNGRDPRPFITVSKGQRQAVYSVSPTFSLMKNSLEIPSGTGWNAANCNAIRVCDEAGSWFPWALRDAAMATRQISSASTFQEFFRKVSVEIEAGCKSKSLECDGPGFSVGVKKLNLFVPHEVLDSAFRITDAILQYSPVSDTNRPATSSDRNLLVMWRSVMHFNYVTTAAGNNNWVTVPNYLNTMIKPYTYLTYAGIILLVVFLISKRKRDQLLAHIFIVFLLIGLAIYIFGLSLFEVGLGFPIGVNLYSLPIFPNLLMAVSIGTLALIPKTSPREEEKA
jgi:hypothetical protein